MADETMHIDFETRSAAPFGTARNAVNVYVYAAHETTDMWCAQIAIGDDDPHLWVPGDSLPKHIENHMKAGAPRAAHNAQFERVIWQRLLTPRYGWPETDIPQWDCTMARALAMALPAGLGMCARALRLDVEKDGAGHRLMMQMAKPRKLHDDGAIAWWDEEEKRLALYDYCRTDVIVERELDKKLFRLSDREREIYWLDQRMNDRGICVDQRVRRIAQKTVDDLMADADAEMERITKGAVAKTTQAGQLRGWVTRRRKEDEAFLAAMAGRKPDLTACEVTSVAKDKLDELLALDLPPDVMAAVELRAASAKTSTAKLSAFERHEDADGRVRGGMQYAGAGRTGRWAGRGVQIQNLPRPSADMEDVKQVEFAYRVMLAHGAEGLRQWFENPLSTVSDTLRGIIRSAEGHQLDCADFANIEGRVLAWVAGEHWKLDAFRAYDAKMGPDLYLVAAGKIFGKDPNEMKPQRQIGKVSELALGFQGGAVAFATMGKTYGLRIGEKFDEIWSVAADWVKEECEEGWAAYGSKMGMTREAWMAAEAIKRPWRRAHPATEALWAGIEEAAIACVHTGEPTVYGKIMFRMVGTFLALRLPSGRPLFYAFPRLEEKRTPWGTSKETLIYEGVNGYTRQWEKVKTYGGKLVENIVQATARDLLADAMVRVDRKYPLVMTVHDEIVSETPAGFGDHDEFQQMMAQLPLWAGNDMPVSVTGWRGERYRK